jgi:DNA-binding XRE family transcriptional regulator
MAIEKISDGSDIAALRKALSLNQAEMANKMGLSARAYFTLESEPGSINARHIMLAEHVALTLAVERGDRSLVPKKFADLADKFAKIRKK